LPEQTVNLDVKETFSKAKAALQGEGCKIQREAPPKTLVVTQGSLMGIAPRTAKKTITVTFESTDEKTRLRYASAMAKDWKYVTIIGCILAVALVALCIWMGMDLDAFMASGQPGVWSWLIAVEGKVDFQVGKAFADLTYGLAVFLCIVVAIEAVVYVNVQRRIDGFAEEVLGSLN
jgi:hypothetical protein